ncbi:MAG: sugar kinase [Gammaproteobacteria bacterium]|nr:sugar kinase [Gammaproteobacteria bacterium]MDH3448537.1 sugar kinase [Gammaproteobacteria bacterium]
MSRAVEHRFILVTRKTRLQELIERFNTWPQARFYLEHNQVDAQDYLDEHDLYSKRIHEAESRLRSMGPVQKLERRFLPNYQFGRDDIVVVIGQDGLVANTLKYLDGQPVIGINPDPDRWDGKLLPFEIGDIERALAQTLSGRGDRKSVTFAEASTNLGQRMLAVNDLFIGPKSHVSARYHIDWNGQVELQSSSGIIVSTGFGSTGWFQSVLAGAVGVAGLESHPMASGFAWDAERLQFAVREPFPSQTTGVRLVFGEVSGNRPLTIESLMPEYGVIFSDGIEDDAIAFNSGCIARIDVSDTRGVLVC